ncbi:hypothetical protein BJ878DRAFT_574199 [Calycina marina]|uniref:Uncharacterized protein n=1 Tax=Calycina marina TaxID=1763456 RepID=A0A9P7Z6G3_9HELO|nr:hypothetical protein BJ878DRAFT_574199 [Calycina marina]
MYEPSSMTSQWEIVKTPEMVNTDNAFAALGKDRNCRNIFMMSLLKDFPELYGCTRCEKLHQVRNTKVCLASEIGMACPLMTDHFYITTYDYRIHPAQVWLAMDQRYAERKQSMPLSQFQHVQQRSSWLRFPLISILAGSEYIRLVSFDAQAVAGDLLLRSQGWNVLPLEKQDRLLHRISESFCHHGKETNIMQLLRWQLENFTSSEEGGTDVWGCPICLTDIQVHVVMLDPGKIALITTSWSSFGTGLPGCTVWKEHQSQDSRLSAKQLVCRLETSDRFRIKSLLQKVQEKIRLKEFRLQHDRDQLAQSGESLPTPFSKRWVWRRDVATRPQVVVDRWF